MVLLIVYHSGCQIREIVMRKCGNECSSELCITTVFSEKIYLERTKILLTKKWFCNSKSDCDVKSIFASINLKCFALIIPSLDSLSYLSHRTLFL